MHLFSCIVFSEMPKSQSRVLHQSQIHFTRARRRRTAHRTAAWKPHLQAQAEAGNDTMFSLATQLPGSTRVGGLRNPNPFAAHSSLCVICIIFQPPAADEGVTMNLDASQALHHNSRCSIIHRRRTRRRMMATWTPALCAAWAATCCAATAARRRTTCAASGRAPSPSPTASGCAPSAAWAAAVRPSFMM